MPQYAHAWRVSERLVKDFDAGAWLQAGRGGHCARAVIMAYSTKIFKNIAMKKND